MKRIGKLFLFLLNSLAFITIGAAIQLFCIVSRLKSGRILAKTTMLWSRSLLPILGIAVHVKNSNGYSLELGSLIVSNHQSYLDIIVAGSVLPTLFVAKKQVKSWPILGWLALIGGTVFIDREAFRGALKSTSEIDRSLRDGVNVYIFPEGTSTNGSVVLPFRSFLFNSAVSSGCPVQPITILYDTIDGLPAGEAQRDIICWYGEMTFFDHFWELLSHHSIVATIIVQTPIRDVTSQSPQVLSELAFSKVNSSFQPLI